MSWIVIGALVLTLFSGSTVAVAQAADGSIPGDLLYPLDTALGSIRRTITTNPGARVELELIIAQERLDEAQQLEDEGGDDAGIQAALDAYAEAVNDATLALMAADLDDEGWAEMELLLTETRTLRDAVMNQIPLSAAEEARALAELALEQVEDVLGPVPVDELPPDKPIPSPDPDVPPTDDEDL